MKRGTYCTTGLRQAFALSSLAVGCFDPEPVTAGTQGSSSTTGFDGSGQGSDGGTASTSNSDEDDSGRAPESPAPIAVDDEYFVRQGLRLEVPADAGVLRNDQIDGIDVTPILATESQHGATVELRDDGGFSFEPRSGWWGKDEFTYRLGSDGPSANVRVAVAPTLVSLREVEGGAGGFVINAESSLDNSGYSVAGNVDVNGDGIDDLIVSSAGADPDPTVSSTGRTYVVFGGQDVGSGQVSLAEVGNGVGGYPLDGEAEGDRTGYTVAALGDVNQDGRGDFATTSINHDGSAGRTYVAFGKDTGTRVELRTFGSVGGSTIDGASADDRSGRAIAGPGDVDGDGLADVLVGAPDCDINGTNSGCAYVVFGGTGPESVSLASLSESGAGFEILGDAALRNVGSSVSGAGDLDGDGLADLFVGAPSPDGEVVAYVVFGKATTEPVTVDELGDANLGFGIMDAPGPSGAVQVAGGGDVNGDGWPDLVLGLPGLATNDLESAGRVYVIFGRDTWGPIFLSDIEIGDGGIAIDGQSAGHLFGSSVAVLGDVDGDGLDDLGISAPGAMPGDVELAGRDYVIFGQQEMTSVSLDAVASGEGGFAIDGYAMNHALAAVLAAAGDVNADGYADLLLGRVGASSGDGRTYVLFGGRFQPPSSAPGG